jgi:hypothetical protein
MPNIGVQAVTQSSQNASHSSTNGKTTVSYEAKFLKKIFSKLAPNIETTTNHES